jgi:hypothetical protein
LSAPESESEVSSNLTASAGGAGADTAASGLVLLRLTKLGKMVRLLRLLRLTRISTRAADAGHPLARQLRALLGNFFKSRAMWLLRHGLILLFVVHWSACVQFLIAGGTDDDAPQNTWVARAGMAAGDDDVPRHYSMAMLHAGMQIFAAGSGLVPPERTEE